MIDKSNHGNVGEALYVKMTLQEFNKVSGRKVNQSNMVLTPDDLSNNYGISASVPIYITDNVLGDFEVVCEDGIEVHEWDIRKDDLNYDI